MSVETRPTARVAAQPDAVPTMPIWRLSVSQYRDMIAAGILTDDDPVELLEGWLVPKMPKNPAHRLSTQLTREALERALPTTMSDSEPEPDVVVHGERHQYRDRHPSPEDVALAVEIAHAGCSATARSRSNYTPVPASLATGSSTWWMAGSKHMHNHEAGTKPTTSPSRFITYRTKRR